MESIIFEIYGTLILTLAGFALPILAIVISVLPEGVELLKETYGNQQSQAEKNLEIEMEKKKLGGNLDYAVLEKNIINLKSSKIRAEKRLLYLSPQYFLLRSSSYLSISLIYFFISLFLYSQLPFSSILLFFPSIVFLFFAIVVFFNTITIIIEAASASYDKKLSLEEKKMELLTSLVDNSKTDDDPLFINQERINIYFNGEKLEDNKEYTFSANKQHSITVQLSNSSEYILKTAELGLYFPEEFLIEMSSRFSIYTKIERKILRFKHDHVHSGERMDEGSIDMTMLTTGVFEMEAFVKGENFKTKRYKFTITVIP